MLTEESSPQIQAESSLNPTCPNCSVIVGDVERFCHNCGHALSPVAIATPAAETPKPFLIPDPAIAKGIRQARTALLVVAILQVLAGILFAGLQMHDAFAIAGVFIVAAIFWGLWFWAKKSPLPATIAGLVTFVTVHIGDIIVDPKQIFQGLIMKIVVIVFLVKGITAALDHRNAQKRMADGQTNQP